MRYLTNDGTEFTELEEAKAHEQMLAGIDNRKPDIDRFLEEERSDKSDRSHTLYRRIIEEWLTWEAQQQTEDIRE